MAKKKASTDQNRVVYAEFGSITSEPEADAVVELPPNQQKIRVQVSRKGRKGKTVTILTGFQAQPETLNALLKQLKTLCGSGGTVKEQSLEIQGDHRDQVIAKLTQLGYSNVK
jgi:translation initiation factor 1